MKNKNKFYLRMFLIILSIFLCIYLSIELSTSIKFNSINFNSIVGIIVFLTIVPFLFINKTRVFALFLGLIIIPLSMEDFFPGVLLGYENEMGNTTFSILAIYDIFFLMFLYLQKKHIKEDVFFEKTLKIIIFILVFLSIFNFIISSINIEDYKFGALLRGSLIFARLILIYYLFSKYKFKLDIYNKIFMAFTFSSVFLISMAFTFSILNDFERLIAPSFGMNIFANFLVLLSITLFSGIFHYKNLKIRIFLGLIFCLNIYAIISTGTRIALISLIIGLFLYLLFVKIDKIIKIVIFACSFLSIGILTSFLNLQSSRFYILLNPIEFLNTVELSTSTTLGTRLLLWKASFEMFKKNPFFGQGPGQWNFNRYDYGINFNVLLDPHNGYIALLAEYGIFIFITYIIFVCINMIYSIKLLKAIRTTNYYNLVLGINVGLVCWFLTELSNAGIYRVQIQYIVWMIMICNYFMYKRVGLNKKMIDHDY